MQRVRIKLDKYSFTALVLNSSISYVEQKNSKVLNLYASKRRDMQYFRKMKRNINRIASQKH